MYAQNALRKKNYVCKKRENFYLFIPNNILSATGVTQL